MDAARRAQARGIAVADALARIRAIETGDGVTRHSIEAIRDVLIDLAARSDLFPMDDFPAPVPGLQGQPSNALYRLNEDADHRFALYAQLTDQGTRTPVHDHTTWAVIVGLQGAELNRFYERTESGGVRQTGEAVVQKGSGIALMPSDLHAIQIEPGVPTLNFHLYGLALEQLHGRRYYRETEGDWAHFPASSGIRDLPAAA